MCFDGGGWRLLVAIDCGMNEKDPCVARVLSLDHVVVWLIWISCRVWVGGRCIVL